VSTANGGVVGGRRHPSTVVGGPQLGGVMPNRVQVVEGGDLIKEGDHGLLVSPVSSDRRLHNAGRIDSGPVDVPAGLTAQADQQWPLGPPVPVSCSMEKLISDRTWAAPATN
jgi:hypothetical protein